MTPLSDSMGQSHERIIDLGVLVILETYGFKVMLYLLHSVLPWLPSKGMALLWSPTTKEENVHPLSWGPNKEAPKVLTFSTLALQGSTI